MSFLPFTARSDATAKLDELLRVIFVIALCLAIPIYVSLKKRCCVIHTDKILRSVERRAPGKYNRQAKSAFNNSNRTPLACQNIGAPRLYIIYYA